MSRVINNPKRSFIERRIKGPVGFRQFLERAGPTFIKIGQYLALRPDLIPQEYCFELMRLMDEVPPAPWAEAKAILTADLGQAPEVLFAHVNPKPVAAGSLAQTHVAHLLDGTEVALKIQRPDIRARVLRDLKRARLLARLLELSGGSFIVSPREVVQEISRWMLQEIDFKHELANLSRLHRLADDSPSEKIPQPYPELSADRVLTSEYLQGIPFSDILRMLRSDRVAANRKFEDLGINCESLAKNLITACLRQVFRYQFFHADLHPGNLIALPDSIIGFVDFGLCDELDENVREKQVRYLAAVYNGQVDQIYKALTEILIRSDKTDIEAFRRDFTALPLNWTRRDNGDSDTHPVPARRADERSPVAHWMIRVMRLAREHHMKVPARILSMYRALLTAETVANQLSPGVSLRSVGRDFFEDLQLREAVESFEPDNVKTILVNELSLVRDAPGSLHQILSEVADGRFTLNVNVSEAPSVKRGHDRRARLLVTAILAVGVAVLLSIPNLPVLMGVSVSWPLTGFLLLLYLWALIQWRRLR